MDARHVPVDYSYRWIFCSIEIAKRHYSLFLATGLLLIFSVLGLSFIPYLGPVAGSLMSFLYTLGALRLAKQVFHSGTGTFDDFLKFTFDPIVFQKYAPFLIIIGVVNVASVVLAHLRIPYIIVPWSFLSNLTMFVAVHAAFMMHLNPQMKWDEAVKAVLRGSWLNVIALVALSFFTIIFAIGSFFMCIVGSILYFVPMTMPMNYLVFSSIYEGLDIEMTIKEWSSKSNDVQTVPAPADEP